MKSTKLLLLSLLVLASLAQAESEEVFNYRSAVMKSVGGEMSSIVAILKGQVYSENLTMHTAALEQLAEIATTIFPEGSDFKKSEALPKIWQEPQAFKSRMDDFVSAAKNLNQVASGEDMSALGGAVQDLGKSCKGCHDDFREEHSH